MADNVVKLKGVAEIPAADANAEVGAWLRKQADEMESGKAQPVHKAVLVVFQDLGDEVRINSAFCNARIIERVGMLHVAANDIMNGDD